MGSAPVTNDSVDTARTAGTRAPRRPAAYRRPLTARDLLDAVGSRGDELVRVRVDASLDGSDAVNERLAELESGEVDPKSAGGRGGSPSDPSTPF